MRVIYPSVNVKTSAELLMHEVIAYMYDAFLHRPLTIRSMVLFDVSILLASYGDGGYLLFYRHSKF